MPQLLMFCLVPKEHNLICRAEGKGCSWMLAQKSLNMQICSVLQFTHAIAWSIHSQAMVRSSMSRSWLSITPLDSLAKVAGTKEVEPLDCRMRDITSSSSMLKDQDGSLDLLLIKYHRGTYSPFSNLLMATGEGR